MNHPSRENVFILTNDEDVRTAIIINKKVYSLTELGDEDIAELFNGGILPIVPSALTKKP